MLSRAKQTLPGDEICSVYLLVAMGKTLDIKTI